MFRHKSSPPCDGTLLDSQLFDQNTFYEAFLADLQRGKRQVIIESPFITGRRVSRLLPAIRRLRQHGVTVVINTKPIYEQEPELQMQVKEWLSRFNQMGVTILLTGRHHRKLAVIDRQIVWEGSLNILSQYDSCEIMRRIYSEQLANQMIEFLHLEKFTSGVV